MPSVSPASPEMPGVPSSAIARPSAYSWFGPPEPLPLTVTVNSPPDMIATFSPRRLASSAMAAWNLATSRASPSSAVAEDIDAVAFGARDFGRGFDRGFGGCNDFIVRRRELGVAGFQRFVGRVVQRRRDLRHRRNVPAGEHSARVAQRRAVGNRRARADFIGVIARHVGDRYRQQARGM